MEVDILQETANYLQRIMVSVPFPRLLPSEREKLDEARAIVLRLKTLEEERTQ